MRFIALYSDDNGNQQAAIFTASADFDPADDLGTDEPKIIGHIEDNYNSGGGLFIVDLPDDDSRPAVLDQYGDEVPVSFYTID